MKLLIEDAASTIEVVNDFENYLSPATRGVAIGNVGTVLAAIRTAAAALNPPTYTPAQLEQITNVVYNAATHLKALAGKAPADDPDAQATLELLRALGLENPPPVSAPPPPLAPVNVDPPAITGTLRAGQQLTASNGTWQGTDPITFAYRWHRCDAQGTNCSPIVVQAQTPSYTVKSADVGSTLRVAVTATNGSGTKQALSDPTVVVTT